MATVNLASVVLGPVDDLAAQVALEVTSLREQDAVSGAVRTYAGGRRRSVTRAGTLRTFPITADVLRDRLQLDLLRSWKGRLLLLRDPRGRKVFGTFYDLDVEENITTDLAFVALTLHEVTFSEFA